MQRSIFLRIFSINDKEIQNVFSNIISSIDHVSYECNASYARGLSFKFDPIDEDLEFEDEFTIQEASLIVKFVSGYYQVVFRRSTSHTDPQSIDRRIHEPSMRYNEFEIIPSDIQGKDIGKAGEILKEINKFQSAIPETGPQESIDAFRELVSSFNRSHQKMLRDLSKKIIEIDDRRSDLENEFIGRNKRIQEDHEKKIAELEIEREKLDLESHKATRRRILRDINEESAERASRMVAPPGARLSRWAIYIATMTIGVFAAVLSYASIQQIGITNDETQLLISRLESITTPEEAKSIITSSSIGEMKWYLILRSIVGSIVAIGAFAFAANWLRSFYKEEIEAAREIEMINYDLNRATWAIETILEVQKEHNGHVPQEWIDGVTRGLFDRSDKKHASDDGAQALGALLGLSASASFGPEGARLNLNKKGLRKLGKAIEEAPEDNT